MVRNFVIHCLTLPGLVLQIDRIKLTWLDLSPLRRWRWYRALAVNMLDSVPPWCPVRSEARSKPRYLVKCPWWCSLHGCCWSFLGLPSEKHMWIAPVAFGSHDESTYVNLRVCKTWTMSFLPRNVSAKRGLVTVVTPFFFRNLMWNSPMTLKYAQGHWHSYHLKAVVWPCM